MVTLTVAELIEALQKMPQDAPVVSYAADECVTSLVASDVELRNAGDDGISWYDKDACLWRHDLHVLVMP